METFLPAWIIGAPLALLLVDLVLTPKVTDRDTTTHLDRVQAPPAR